MRFAHQVALLGAMIAGAAAPMTINAADAGPSLDPVRPDFYRQRKGKGQNNRRGKGKASPPKSRPNRLHMSKRVRRKHRRAA